MATIEKRMTDNGTLPGKGSPARVPAGDGDLRASDRCEGLGEATEADMKKGRHFGQSKRHTFKELADEYGPHAKDAERLDYWRRCSVQTGSPISHRTASPRSATSCWRRRR